METDVPRATLHNVARQNDSAYQQISLFNADKTNEILKILEEINMDDISPRNAYDILTDLKEKAEGEK